MSRLFALMLLRPYWALHPPAWRQWSRTGRSHRRPSGAKRQEPLLEGSFNDLASASWRLHASSMLRWFDWICVWKCVYIYIVVITIAIIITIVITITIIITMTIITITIIIVIIIYCFYYYYHYYHYHYYKYNIYIYIHIQVLFNCAKTPAVNKWLKFQSPKNAM